MSILNLLSPPDTIVYDIMLLSPWLVTFTSPIIAPGEVDSGIVIVLFERVGTTSEYHEH